MSRTCVLLAVVGVAAAAGCSGRLAKVKGRVTCHGKPFAGAAVTFTPIPASDADRFPGKAATGGTDPDGRYELTTASPGDGVMVGRHRVTFGVEFPDRPDPCLQRLGEVVVEVKPGDNLIDIEMKDYLRK